MNKEDKNALLCSTWVVGLLLLFIVVCVVLFQWTQDKKFERLSQYPISDVSVIEECGETKIVLTLSEGGVLE